MLLLLFVSPSLLLPAGRSVRLIESSTIARSSAVRARRSFQNGLARQVDANAGSATQAWLASPKVAARAGRVEALLDPGASPEAANGISNTQLEDAVFFENVELVTKTLLKAGVSLENVELVETVLKVGASFEAEEASSLTDIAILKKYVEALLEADISLEVVVASGLSPLMVAIISENVELVKAVLETGASIEAEDANSLPPLYQAIYGGDVEMVETLIDAGAPLDLVRAPLASSPLLFAILTGVVLELAHTIAPGLAAAKPRGNVNVTKVVFEASLAADPLGVAFSLILFANICYTSWMVPGWFVVLASQLEHWL